MSKLAFASSLLLALTHQAHSAIVTQSLELTNADVSPDGYTRSAVLANAQLPGPLISANASDTFQINVTDSLTDTTMYRGTSIHWHGLFQKGTAMDDGVAWVTQCPIIPGNSFLYNFTVANQTGTYWYHSHVGTQYCDGLRGPLVIYDPDDPLTDLYDVDDETTVITLADWYHNVSNVLFPNTGNVDPTPDATLINGLGRYSGGPTDSSLAVLNVTQGQRYRFRIVSLSCYPSFTFQIDGHNLTVIEADGIETESVEVNSLVIYPGQRYSVVLNATQDVGNYWIRAEPSQGTTGFTNGINSAILRYSGADDEEPTTIENTEGTQLDEADLAPLVNPGAPGEAVAGGVDYALNLDIALNLTSGAHMVNDVEWVNPTIPVLLQVLSGTTSASDLLPSGSIYALPGNSTIEISMPGGASHPMHLHGHNFDVVRVAGSDEYNYVNPPRRDVVNIGVATDNVTIRFTTDNSGPWFLHCHIDWHLAAGLAVVMVEDADDIASADPVTDAWSALCPEYSAADPDTAFE
ncbi:Cu-oxidase-domain-containing protein [Fomitiporia mediterranea MF3/22]|uniref:Cu-oxidase-domain-containing protein n=1 Tax=Fomitiporia mediterranea (strain MF3/22) TaxID=694068 RepID=UPI000440901D|nr:Cu-oxidase-domain-containing protein [Fomitiporia mediterranea MF3/22]EJD00073.1 Cu-oxidase-domain-containing protein [Fomitiporia mediterranea MF3/22]